MFDKIPFPFFMKRTVHGLFKLPISLRHGGDSIAAAGITPRSRRKCADLTNVLVIHLRTLLSRGILITLHNHNPFYFFTSNYVRHM